MAITLFSADEIPVVGEPEDVYSSHAQAFAYGVQRLASEINAEAALENAATTTTSVTSQSLTVGSKTFAVATGLGWAAGMAGRAANTASATNYANFTCTSYSGSSLVVNFDSIVGSGAGITTWTITKSSSASNTATLTSNTFTGTQSWAQGADVASSTTVNLTALADGNLRALTGTTTINAWTIANGVEHNLVYTGAGLTLTYSATTNRLNSGGANVTLATNDRLRIFARGGVVHVEVIRDVGTNLVETGVLPSFTAVANTPANGVTITLPSGFKEFRNATIADGTPVMRNNASAVSTVISSGSTGGATNNVASRIAVLAVDTGTGFVPAWRNISDGIVLDETGLITTVAEGGAGGADSATTIYATAVHSNRPYRLLGYYDETQTTAGTHSAALTKVAAVKSDDDLYQTFKSSAQTITSAGLLTLAHGLGYIPTNFKYRLKNTTTEAGWAVNDEVQIGFGDYQNGRHTQVYADIQNVYVRYGNSATVFVAGHKTTGVSTVLTNTSWNLLVEAGR